MIDIDKERYAEDVAYQRKCAQDVQTLAASAVAEIVENPRLMQGVNILTDGYVGFMKRPELTDAELLILVSTVRSAITFGAALGKLNAEALPDWMFEAVDDAD